MDKMIKYKGFPSRMPGTDFQFTIRRANVKGASKLISRERYKHRKKADSMADLTFLKCLIDYFGETVFQRGSLDAGRLSWFINREIVVVSSPFDPYSYEVLLRLDMKLIKFNFPEMI
jgi:hypothetical protein